MIAGMGGMAGPLGAARGAWVSLFGLSFMLIFCVASVLPYPPVHAPRGAWSFASLGALSGVAWACALRSFMAEVAGKESGVEWVNTWAFILLPGLLIGWAEYLRRTGGRPRWRLLALSPLLLAAILVRGLIEDPTHMFEGGIGAGAIAIPVLCIIGGYAMSGRGSLLTRVPAGVVGAATLVVWPLTGTAVGGPSFVLTTPHGLWATVLYDGLLIIFALAASVPQRDPVRAGHRAAPGNNRAPRPGSRSWSVSSCLTLFDAAPCAAPRTGQAMLLPFGLRPESHDRTKTAIRRQLAFEHAPPRSPPAAPQPTVAGITAFGAARSDQAN
jgi:hypothetical protein